MIPPLVLGKARPDEGTDSPGTKKKSEGETSKRWWSEPDWWVAICTGTLTVATIALGVFTYLLWRETRYAVRDTAKGLKIAEHQAYLSEQALIASNRSHLLFEPELTPSKCYNHRATFDPPFFTYAYRVYGNGPAIIKNSAYEILLLDHQVKQEDVVFSSANAHYYVLVPSSATRQVKVTSKKWTNDSVADVNDERLYVYAVGQVEYEGPRGSRHETGFCWRYHPKEAQFREDDSQPHLNRRT